MQVQLIQNHVYKNGFCFLESFCACFTSKLAKGAYMFVWPKILFLLILYDAEEMTNALFPLKNT